MNTLSYQMDPTVQMDDYQKSSKPHPFLLLLILLLTLALFVFIFQFSWNYTMPSVFGLGNVNFIQAFLLLLVARILIPNCPAVNTIFASIYKLK